MGLPQREQPQNKQHESDGEGEEGRTQGARLCVCVPVSMHVGLFASIVAILPAVPQKLIKLTDNNDPAIDCNDPAISWGITL